MQKRYRSSYSGYSNSAYGKPRRYSGLDFLVPFLILVCIGLVLILLFNLWNAFFGETQKRAALMHIAEGSVQMKTWGTQDFFTINENTVVMQGDEIVTSAKAKVVLEFFDGTIVRLAGNTDVTFTEIDDDADKPRISLLLLNGNIWINKLYKKTAGTEMVVRSSNVEFVAKSDSIFAIENGIDEIARVLRGGGGDLLFSVYDKNGEKVVDSGSLGIGQEVVFTENVLQSYWQFKSPNVVEALNDDFKNSEWFVWNLSQDKKPLIFDKESLDTGLVKVLPQINQDKIEKKEDGENTDKSLKSEEVSLEKKVKEEGDGLINLAVLSVSGVDKTNDQGGYVVSANPAVISGSVSGKVEKLMVNDYLLQKFKPGDTKWNYFANANYGLMRPGENTYKVVAFDATGKKNAEIVLKVFYKPVPPSASSENVRLPKEGSENVKPDSSVNPLNAEVGGPENRAGSNTNADETDPVIQ